MTESKNFPGGVWPVMITPFCCTGEVDYEGLKKLTEWYIEKGCDGLFAVCQSSEMFNLTVEERIKVATTVVETVSGRIPVIASGNICENVEEQVEEVKKIAQTGVDAVILITNQFAKEDESDEIWMQRCSAFIDLIPENIPLGFYECPYPYKRLIYLENLKECMQSGRFYFLKDTCCDIDLINDRLDILRGGKLKLYNANSTTLLESLRNGAAGFSGVMANFHPQLYKYLCEHKNAPQVDMLQDFLSMTSLIERQYYPVNAKYYLQQCENIPIKIFSRKLNAEGFTKTFKRETEMLAELTTYVGSCYGCK